LGFKFTVLDDRTVIYALHPSAPPNNADWDRYVDMVAAAVASQNAVFDRLLGFTVTDGGAPNAAQRKRLVDRVMQGQRPRAVIITDSILVRGVVTAFSWLARTEFSVFKPSDIRQALREVRLPADVVLSDLREIQRDLPPVASVSAIERALLDQ
jgi:hypothetical protein